MRPRPKLVALSIAITIAVIGCTPADAPDYRMMGPDDDGRAYLLDMDSFGTTTDFGARPIDRATILLRKDSGYTQVAHVAFSCSEGTWHQNAFAGESEKPVIIPQNWPGEPKTEISANHPMRQILKARCDNRP